MQFSTVLLLAALGPAMCSTLVRRTQEGKPAAASKHPFADSFRKVYGVRLKLKAKDSASIIQGKTSPDKIDTFKPQPGTYWIDGHMHAHPELSRKIDSRDKHSLAGQASSRGFITPYGKSTGSIRGPEVRADIGTQKDGKAQVIVRDPSRRHYPTGSHVEEISGMTTKTFRASSSYLQPGKIKFKMEKDATAQLDGQRRDSIQFLDSKQGGDRHRLPKGYRPWGKMTGDFDW